jgi:hypothetical protein
MATWAYIVERFATLIGLERLLELTAESGCCKPNRPWMIGFDETVSAFYIFRPDCKCWNCPSCAKRLRARWTKRAYLGIEAYIADGLEFKFVTVTSHERLYSLYQTLYVWPNAWGKLRKRIDRAAGNWKFLMIPEQHRDGRLHVHLIASTDLGTRWWKDNARACGLGYTAEEEEFRAGKSDPLRAAAYAAKYLDKQLGVRLWPRYFHHIRTSQSFPELPIEPDNSYDAVNWTAHTLRQTVSWLAKMQHNHQTVFYTGTGERIS